MPSLEVVEVPVDDVVDAEAVDDNDDEQQHKPDSQLESNKKRKFTPTNTETKPKSSKDKKKKNQLTLGSFFGVAKKPKSSSATNGDADTTTPPVKTPSSTKSSVSKTATKAPHPSQLDYMAETRKSALRDIVVGRQRPSAKNSTASTIPTTATKNSTTPLASIATTAEMSNVPTSSSTAAGMVTTSTNTTTATSITTTTTTSKTSKSMASSRGITNKPSPNRLFLEDDDGATKDTILATEETDDKNDNMDEIQRTSQKASDEMKTNNANDSTAGTKDRNSENENNKSKQNDTSTIDKPTTKDESSAADSPSMTKAVPTPIQLAKCDSSNTKKNKKQPATKTAKTSPHATKKAKTTTSPSGTEDASPTQAVANSRAAATKQPPAAQHGTPTDSPKQLSKEAQDLLKKHSTMRENYCRRANALLQQCRAGLESETFDIPIQAAEKPAEYEHISDSFPDFAVPTLAALLEGRHEALSVLAGSVVDRLTELYGGDASLFSLNAVTAKIKLLATRKNYIKNPTIASGLPIMTTTTTNVFEDESEDHMWRWEVAVIELLPEACIPNIKKARSARKKLSSHFNALAKLLSSLNDADALLIQNNNSGSILAKISQEEEKVLKYEREEEKSRLAAEAKRSKEMAKAEARAKKELEAKEKQQMVEEKRKEKERKKEEAAALKQKKKDQAAQAKRQKDVEREEELAQKQAELDKQKNLMNSFFAAAKKKTKRAPLQQIEPASQQTPASTMTPVASDTFDVERFRAAISSKQTTCSSLPPAQIFSSSISKRASRKRRSKRVTVSVFVTVYPEEHDEMNPFAAQPYAEQQDVEIVNKNKFFSFHEDVRPAYYGTWSKKSEIITGTKPFAKDTSFLDYDVDSEAEWEEGDDEIGEELGDDKADADEDMKMEVGGGDDDGWLAADDEVEDDLDEETKQLRQKKKTGKDVDKHILTVCIIAPGDGGKPLSRVTPDGSPTQFKGRIEGFAPNEAFELIEKLSATRLDQSELFLDAFPPSDDFDANQDPSAPNAPSNSSSQVMTDENMQCFARFIHNCTLGSKDKVVDELLKANPKVTSRAQAYRILDSIAEKKKHPRNGVFWEVKKDVLESLGLGKLADTTVLDTDDAKQEAMKTIACFVHNCTTASKEKIVDELRIQHDSVTSSRAEATRILTSISEKKKHPISGYYWEVKEDVREELGLTDLPSSPPTVASTKAKESRGKAFAEAMNSSKKAVESQISAKKANPNIKTGGSSMSSQEKSKTPASSLPSKKSSGQKRPAVSAGSAKLLANFVKKKKST